MPNISEEKKGIALLEERLKAADDLKRTAFAAVVTSTVASVIAVVLIPMLYSYLQYVQIRLEDDLGFCRLVTLA
jgi:hypothetical protein